MLKNNKTKVAFISLLATLFLASFKIIVGLATGSLGILSEALDSFLDTFASGLTLFAVNYSNKPADKDHNFGHGKIENLSALIESILLLLTSIWIIYEAFSRLITKNTHFDVSVWSFIVVITSISINIIRSCLLRRAAKKYNSQALEADALNFTTDIFSSVVVLIGITASYFGFYFADTFAGLAVSFVIIFAAFKMSKKAVNALLDKSPTHLTKEVFLAIQNINEVKDFHDVRIRTSGANVQIEVSIHVEQSLTIKQAHDISTVVEFAIMQKIPFSQVHIHIEPDN